MPEQLRETDMVDWLITFDRDLSPITAQAAYPTTDERLPGWTVLKDYKHKIVAMVRDSATVVIQRTDETQANAAQRPR